MSNRNLAIVTEDRQPDSSLPELAERITAEYQSIMNAMGNGVMAIGEMLAEAQIRVQQAGLKWSDWVEESLPFGRRQAAKYLTLAKDTRMMMLNGNHDSHFTTEQLETSPSLRAGLRALVPQTRRVSRPVRKKQAAKRQEDDVIAARATYLAWLLAQDKETKRNDLRLLLEQAQITAKDFAFVTMPLNSE